MAIMSGYICDLAGDLAKQPVCKYNKGDLNKMDHVNNVVLHQFAVWDIAYMYTNLN